MSVVEDPALRALTDCLGVGGLDAGDEHQRWQLYLRALGSAGCAGELLAALGVETDVNVALSVVLRAMETTTARDRQRWVTPLRSPPTRAYAERRRHELAILEDLALSDSLADDAERDWSDWLQSGLAVKSTEPAVLRRLADHGRTKRIRRMARERLERLSS